MLTNDDGIYAGGLKTLLEVMEEFGKVVLISSAEGMSGMAQAITVKTPLRVKLLEETEKHIKYVCNGTPADCVKMAITQLLDRMPDWVVSGVNHGSNASASVLYSGTMGAAIEGCINGITSVGFSLDNYSSTADFSACKKYIRKVMQMLTQGALPQGICLNVNIPKAEADQIKGIKICRHAGGSWKDDFEKRIDPMGKAYYWLTGEYVNHEPDATDTDEWALANNYVSVAPVSVDMTAHEYLNTLRERFKQ